MCFTFGLCQLNYSIIICKGCCHEPLEFCSLLVKFTCVFSQKMCVTVNIIIKTFCIMCAVSAVVLLAVLLNTRYVMPSLHARWCHAECIVKSGYVGL